MNKKLRIAGIIGALTVSAIILTSPSNAPPLPEPTARSGNEFVEVLATGLDKPWAIDFADSRVFITEKDGKIRVVKDGTLLKEPLVTLRTADEFEGGLLGIATHPDFESNHFLYVYYTYEENGNLWNMVLRIK